ncbi:PTS transporter subunit EIIC [Liquorilactobacillus mali]|uniref:PTS system sucrose-specific transporter subunit EIIBC n=1 Tax=Liquorilactobacillus mali KCTC 3596 = DSM 20444 TaxID=1046596 RepID=J0US88_9LACO|nr:PTS transporter subunit EIIC [Liquorilactobacillus mali]EJE99707.1 PTS system sucrose-specific transporter subunit EIIBC [Liquorilactobacillus mali KCTC 3596 = DSM 20444]KRN08981.1 PTS system sucrose-specific transporter subunit EIIBC [Liquorilactobacillus mali KCTC 3596 = DSM 20444]MDC7953480.1 PTS transporter subunit EIIC [Liquorilactobacillus mali]QFQ73873.1 PTS sugar transporter [Liquorilactobacillus mali]
MKHERKVYEKISDGILPEIGGKDNAIEAFHCATRLRINLKDTSKVNTDKISQLDLVKGVNITRNQLQIIFGAGLVDEVTSVFIQHTGIPAQSTENSSAEKDIADPKEEKSWFSRFLDDLTGVFSDILPGILAGGILIGVNNLFTQKIIGSQSLVQAIPGLSGISVIINLGASGIFAMLPLLVCYAATKRYGGRPVMGLAIGTVMMSSSLPSMSDVQTGAAKALIANIFGWHLSLTGFGGQIIVALIMGYIVAKTDNFFQKKLPGVIQFVLAPMLTILVASFLLFMVIGPVGVALSTWITKGLVWMSSAFGIFGYIVFGGIQQLIVITGLHNMFGAVEAQLIASTKYDFLNPLFSGSLMGQGGGVLGYMLLNRKNKKAQEVGISAFFSVLFGISEPALFGINIKNRYPLIGGCIGGAVAAGFTYLTKITAVAFGTTGLTGIAIAAPQNNGYLNYILMNVIGCLVGMFATIIIGKFFIKKQNEVA